MAVSRFTAHLSRLALLLLILPLTASAAIKQDIPDLRPPREELPASLDRYDPLPWFIAAVAVGVLAAALAWPRGPRQKAVESPSARARRELRESGTAGKQALSLDLKEKLGLPARQSRIVAREVSQVLRRFLIAELGLPGEGVTTEEIHNALASEEALSAKVTGFLAACDAAKFAPATIPPADLVETALGLIEAVERRARATRALHAVQTVQKPATP